MNEPGGAWEGLYYSDTNNDGAITPATEIIEESNYYPFGLKHKGYNDVITSGGNSVAQKFKYNGIELEENTGLYEMDVRMYDPTIGRFNGIDPVTHFSQGTSVAFDNNPVYWADPSGADSVKDLVNQMTPGVKYTSNGDGTFTGNGHTIGTKTDPKEGASREVSTAVCGYGEGCIKTRTEYYHKGGVNGSESGWYGEGEYLDKFRLITRAIGQGQASIDILNKYDFADEMFLTMVAWSVKNYEGWGGKVPLARGNIKSLSFLDIFPGKLSIKGITKLKNFGKFAFWSGKNTQSAALLKGFSVLGNTRAGKNLAKLTAGLDYIPGDKNSAWGMWGRLSSALAKSYKRGSTANVFLTKRAAQNPLSIWNVYEKPVLIKNGVKIKYNWIK